MNVVLALLALIGSVCLLSTAIFVGAFLAARFLDTCGWCGCPLYPRPWARGPLTRAGWQPLVLVEEDEEGRQSKDLAVAHARCEKLARGF